MNNCLKNVLAFVAGGATFVYCISRAMLDRTENLREGTVMYEDENVQVIRMTDKKANDRYGIATIKYKQHSETEE